MDYLKIEWPNVKRADIKRIVAYLKKGKVVVLPTDTIYGLHANADDKHAVNLVRLIKKSDKDKPLINLVSSLTMAKRYGRISQKQAAYLSKIWPGPVTVILERKETAARPVNGKNMIGIRLPKNEFLTTIINKLKQPIVSTSLNLSGHQALKSVESIKGYFRGNKPDLIVDAGKLKATRPSKIIDIRKLNEIKIIRN